MTARARQVFSFGRMPDRPFGRDTVLVRIPEFEIKPPNWDGLRSFARRAVIASGIVAALVALADWRLNSRIDRTGLERLVAQSASDPGSAGAAKTGRR